MKRLVVLLLFVIAGGNVTAQNDAKAKALLNEVSEKVKTYKNISIDFKYELDNVSENIKQQTKGSVTIEGDKYVLNVLGITRIFDGSPVENNLLGSLPRRRKGFAMQSRCP